MLFALGIFVRRHAESDRRLHELLAEARHLLRRRRRVVFEVFERLREVLVCLDEVVTRDTARGELEVSVA